MLFGGHFLFDDWPQFLGERLERFRVFLPALRSRGRVHAEEHLVLIMNSPANGTPWHMVPTPKRDAGARASQHRAANHRLAGVSGIDAPQTHGLQRCQLNRITLEHLRRRRNVRIRRAPGGIPPLRFGGVAGARAILHLISGWRGCSLLSSNGSLRLRSATSSSSIPAATLFLRGIRGRFGWPAGKSLVLLVQY